MLTTCRLERLMDPHDAHEHAATVHRPWMCQRWATLTTPPGAPGTCVFPRRPMARSRPQEATWRYQRALAGFSPARRQHEPPISSTLADGAYLHPGADSASGCMGQCAALSAWPVDAACLTTPQGSIVKCLPDKPLPGRRHHAPATARGGHCWGAWPRVCPRPSGFVVMAARPAGAAAVLWHSVGTPSRVSEVRARSPAVSRTPCLG